MIFHSPPHRGTNFDGAARWPPRRLAFPRLQSPPTLSTHHHGHGRLDSPALTLPSPPSSSVHHLPPTPAVGLPQADSSFSPLLIREPTSTLMRVGRRDVGRRRFSLSVPSSSGN